MFRCFEASLSLTSCESRFKTELSIVQTRELKITRGHLMPPQQHLYNGLADYSFLTGMDSPACLWAGTCWHTNELAGTESVLAYGHRVGQRGWRAAVDTGQTSGRTTAHNVLAAAGYASGSISRKATGPKRSSMMPPSCLQI